jgi:hypothetical protein
MLMMSGHAVRHNRRRRKVTGECRHHRPGTGARREEHGGVSMELQKINTVVTNATQSRKVKNW